MIGDESQFVGVWTLGCLFADRRALEGSTYIRAPGTAVFTAVFTAAFTFASSQMA